MGKQTTEKRRFQSTLPRRERRDTRTRRSYSYHFNPRSRVGSDVEVLEVVQQEVKFQSTLPRRERPSCTAGTAPGAWYFNPRSRVGSDHGRLMAAELDDLFQSTLPRRERRSLQASITAFANFNPRSRVGSDGTTRPCISTS